MNKELLIQRLQQIKAITDQCLNEIYAKGIQSSKKSSKYRSTINSSGVSLSKHILALRDEKFFKQPKSVQEVHKKVLSNYHCELNRVDTALRRLKNKKQLRITSKIAGNKKVPAYVW